MTPQDIKTLRDTAAADHRAQRIAFHEMHLANIRNGNESGEALVCYRAWRRALAAAEGSRAALLAAEIAHPAAAILSLADGEELAQGDSEHANTYAARVRRAERLANAST